MRILIVFLSLYPLLGWSCSCFDFPDRYETLRRGICYGEVFSGVVVGATCSCISQENRVDCREYLYSEDNDTYSAEVITRAQFDSDSYFREFLKTCMQAEDTLAPGIRESVDSLCRDGADMPRPPYIGKACTRPNLEDLSLFRYLTIVYESLCTQ